MRILMFTRARHLLPLLLTAFLLPNCGDATTEPEPPATVEQTCVQGDVTSGAFTLDFPDKRLWVFSETVLNDGTLFLSNTATEVEPCTSDFKLGPPALIPYFETEDPGATRLWPRGGYVRADGVGVVYYDKIDFRGYFDFDVVGTGVAFVTADGAIDRPERLLWEGTGAGFGHGAFADADGHGYLYGCKNISTFTQRCRTARVPLDREGEAAAYTYFDGEAWSTDPDAAATVFGGTLAPTVRPHRDGYVALHPDLFSNDVLIRQSGSPQGPWSSGVKLFTGVSPDQFWIRDVVLHDDDLLTYFSAPTDGPQGLHSLRVDWK
jgi:hypothetical protein